MTDVGVQPLADQACDLGEAFAAAGFRGQRQQGGAVAERRAVVVVAVDRVDHLAGLGEGEPGSAGLRHMVQRGGELGPGEPVADLAGLIVLEVADAAGSAKPALASTYQA